jgi:AcrR family transcriptional regulator
MSTAALKAPTAQDLFALARRRFLRMEPLDIQGLADELGVSRATAYRWAGNVDELTARVIASLVEDTFRLVRTQARGRGVERLIDIHRRGTRYMATSKPYRAWIESTDPQTVLRIVASKEFPVQATTIRLWEEILEAEVKKGTLKLPIDAHTMAYATVRVVESFLYADIIAGEEPDLDSPIEIFKLLVRS